MPNLLFSIIWFTLLYGGTLFLFRKKDLFAPIKFISLLYILRNLTYLIVIYIDPDNFPQYILNSIGMELDDSIVQYTYVQTIAYISLIFGISFFPIKRIKNQFFSQKNYVVLAKCSYIFFFFGIIGYIIFIQQIGGFGFLIRNLSRRTEIISGGYSLILLRLLDLSILFRIDLLNQIEKVRKNKIILFVMVLLTVIIHSSLGGRKSTVFLLLMCIIAYHFLVKPISLKRIKKSRVLLIAFFFSTYTFLIPALRMPNGFQKLVQGETKVSDHINLPDLIGYFSYTYIDIFAANYYNEHNKWNFSSLQTIPENLNIWKDNSLRPPVDEGVYFYNIARMGLEYKPPTPRNKMYVVGLPIENFGFGYANFLVPGVIFSFFALGVVYKLVYNVFLNSYLNPIALFLYMHVLFNFNFSSLRISNMIYLSINLVIAIIIYKNINGKRLVLR